MVYRLSWYAMTFCFLVFGELRPFRLILTQSRPLQILNPPHPLSTKPLSCMAFLMSDFSTGRADCVVPENRVLSWNYFQSHFFHKLLTKNFSIAFIFSSLCLSNAPVRQHSVFTHWFNNPLWLYWPKLMHSIINYHTQAIP